MPWRIGRRDRGQARGRFRSLLPLTVAIAAVAGLMACAAASSRSAPAAVSDVEFVSAGTRLSGVLDQPSGGPARALILFVHGSGRTDIRAENRYADLRRRFADLGIAAFTWDKPGCGRSGGVFDDDQSLDASAREILDAAEALRARGIAGSGRIGIWSTSRGSWVAPMALARDSRFRFWISVSGGAGEDNKFYLLASNLPLEGRTADETRRLLDEWVRGRRIFFEGGSYDAYLAATERLRGDSAVRYFAGDLTGSADTYAAEQRAYAARKHAVELDPATSSLIRVPNLEAMLRGVAIDVLALFGEKDTNVDWRRAGALYKSTVGGNPKASLQVRTFPGCNHAMNPSATGSVREVEGRPLDAGPKCDGYYDAQVEWLRRHVVAD
jgi:uncharacterized protein